MDFQDRQIEFGCLCTRKMNKRGGRCTLQPSVFVVVGLVQDLCISSNAAQLIRESQWPSTSVFFFHNGPSRCGLCIATAFGTPLLWYYMTSVLWCSQISALRVLNKRRILRNASCLSFSDKSLWHVRC